MKRILLFLLIGLLNNLIFAQDIIVEQNCDKIQIKSNQILCEKIKKKELEFQESSSTKINNSNVFVVVNENGNSEKFATTESQISKDNTINNYVGNYFMLGLGIGTSYGRLGLRAQWRTGGIQGFGIHAGAGYVPNGPLLATTPILVSAGVKFFPYKGFYINAQFGMTGQEEYRISYFSDNYENHLLYGPSFMVGGDWAWGRKVGYGFNVGLGFTNNLNAEYISARTLALDLGFIIRF